MSVRVTLEWEGGLRTWHNQFCLNCFNEEIVCDLLDLVGPRRVLSGLAWWVLRYFCSHCKSVINVLPNGKMQKYFSKLDWNKIPFVRECSHSHWCGHYSYDIWWLTFPHNSNLPSCPCFMYDICISCDLRGKDRVTGSSELSDQDWGRLADEVIWLTAIYFLQRTVRIG